MKDDQVETISLPSVLWDIHGKTLNKTRAVEPALVSVEPALAFKEPAYQASRTFLEKNQKLCLWYLWGGQPKPGAVPFQKSFSHVSAKAIRKKEHRKLCKESPKQVSYPQPAITPVVGERPRSEELNLLLVPGPLPPNSKWGFH